MLYVKLSVSGKSINPVTTFMGSAYFNVYTFIYLFISVPISKDFKKGGRTIYVYYLLLGFPEGPIIFTDIAVRKAIVCQLNKY